MSESELLPEMQTPSVSELLVAAREKRGLSQKDVAEQLYLAVHFIRAIDDGEFQKIRKPAFIKGYLRSYARVVDLNGDELVDQYEAALETEHRVDIRNVTEERVGSAVLTGPVLHTGLAGLVVIAVVVALVWWLSAGDEDVSDIPGSEPVTQRAAPAATTEVSQQAPDVITRLAEQRLPQDDSPPRDQVMEDPGGTGAELAGNEAPADDLAGVLADVPADSEVTRDVATSLALKDVIVERTEAEAAQYITIDAGGFEQLEFTFTDECWLEIEDGEGDSIYGDLNRGRDILIVYGVAPFKILLGRASAVTLRFNGEDVDLAQYTSPDQTAKITLGG